MPFGTQLKSANKNGETVQVIEGTLDAGTDPANPDYQSEINGTLTPDGSDLILEIHGSAGSQYDLTTTDNEQTSSRDNEQPLGNSEEPLRGWNRITWLFVSEPSLTN